MRHAPLVRRAGSRIGGWLAAVLLALTVPVVAAAQVTPDTVPADTAAGDTVTVAVPIPPGTVEPDTLPTDSVGADSVFPVPPFPRWPRAEPTGWAFARWQWTRDELLRFHGLSLLQLLERAPGLVAVRSGDFGGPTGLTALGLGGGRVRLFVDGWEQDPLGFTTPDLQRVGLVDVESVRVERTLDGLRVELATLRMPDDARPVSVVEAGTGVYDTKLLRALLMRGFGRRSVVGVAYEQATSAGFGFREPFTTVGARVRWSYALRENTVLQLEYRSDGAESATQDRPYDATDRTLLLRGRSRLRPGLMVDGLIARTTRRAEVNDPLGAELAAVQAAARAAYEIGPAALEGSVRLRGPGGQVGLPLAELVARGVLRPSGWLVAEGELRSATLASVAGAGALATVRAGPFTGVTAFASVAAGARPLALVRDTTRQAERTTTLPGQLPTTDTVTVRDPIFSALSAGSVGTRIGAEWTTPAATLGVAALALGGGTTTPFGFFTVDRALPAVEVEAASGVEAFASVPLPLTGGFVRLDGDYTRWLERGGRPYLPTDHGRAALVAHGMFYDGQLEPTLRVEAERRGAMIVPDEERTAFDGRGGAYSLANLLLQIRILDVRAFLVFSNLTDVRTAADLPPATLPGGRFYYGVHWVFRN